MQARNNPFDIERVRAFGYRPSGWTWEQLLARLGEQRYRAAIVGPAGSGKTALLEDLGRRLREKGFTPHMVRLAQGRRQLSGEQWKALRGLGSADIVLLDGAERLGWWAWWRLRGRCRRAGGLIITALEPGRLLMLVEAAASYDVMEEIVRELLGEQDVPDDLMELFWRHGRNVQHVLQTLHDRWASGS